MLIVTASEELDLGGLQAGGTSRYFPVCAFWFHEHEFCLYSLKLFSRWKEYIAWNLKAPRGLKCVSNALRTLETLYLTSGRHRGFCGVKRFRGKFLPHKHKDLSSDLQPTYKLDIVVHVCNSGAGVKKGGLWTDSWITQLAS